VIGKLRNDARAIAIPGVSAKINPGAARWGATGMSDRRADGGHDAKAAASKTRSSAGKAVGYSNEDPKEVVTGKDGLRPPTSESEKRDAD
jgi:hypothetical protein